MLRDDSPSQNVHVHTDKNAHCGFLLKCFVTKSLLKLWRSKWPWKTASFERDADPAGACKAHHWSLKLLFILLLMSEIVTYHTSCRESDTAKKLMFRDDIGSKKGPSFMSVFYFVIVFSVVSCFILVLVVSWLCVSLVLPLLEYLLMTIFTCVSLPSPLVSKMHPFPQVVFVRLSAFLFFVWLLWMTLFGSFVFSDFACSLPVVSAWFWLLFPPKLKSFFIPFACLRLHLVPYSFATKLHSILVYSIISTVLLPSNVKCSSTLPHSILLPSRQTSAAPPVGDRGFYQRVNVTLHIMEPNAEQRSTAWTTGHRLIKQMFGTDQPWTTDARVMLTRHVWFFIIIMWFIVSGSSIVQVLTGGGIVPLVCW